MRIAREQFPPPRDGRRIPSVGSRKDKAEDRPNARDLLVSVNAASSGASTSWIAFLGTMAYLAVTLSGITHVDLLLDRETTLPFVGVKVPLTAFFVAAPLAFVLVHFGLLLQHVVLSRKLRAFEERLWKEQPTRNRRDQSIRDELHSYSFTQSVSGMPKGTAVDMALRLVMSLSLVVFPLLLLTFFQISFLPYHSEPITWWHRGMLVGDVVLVVVLARYLAKRDRKPRVSLADLRSGEFPSGAKLVLWRRHLARNWMTALRRISVPIGEDDHGSTFVRALRSMLRALRGSGTYSTRAVRPNVPAMGLLVFFSICVATLPHSPDALVPLDKWMAAIPWLGQPLPYGRATKEKTNDGKERVVRCPTHDGAIRCAFWPTAYLFEHEVEEKTGKSDSWLGWSRNLIVTDKDLVDDDKKEVKLSLRGRDLRYATLDRSDLKRADLYRAELGRARLVRTDLRGARLYNANLDGANLMNAALQDADLRYAKLQGVDLREANVRGADFRAASLQGADLRRVDLQGVVLRDAKLQGAAIGGADLHCIDLTVARLQGADLRGANLHGANLDGVSLQGADFSGVKLWNTRAPGVNIMTGPNDEWDLVSFASLRIQPLDNDDRKALNSIVTEFNKLQKDRKKGNPEEALFAEILKQVSGCFDSLVKTHGQSGWKTDDGLKAWCKLAERPSPDPVRLAANLGTLACDDDTDKAYMAQRLVWRTLELKRPNAFLEAFKGCPAFGRIPADLKSQLERAAQQERENPAKPADANVAVPPPPPPEACAKLTGSPSSAPPVNPNPPSSAPR